MAAWTAPTASSDMLPGLMCADWVLFNRYHPSGSMPGRAAAHAERARMTITGQPERILAATRSNESRCEGTMPPSDLYFSEAYGENSTQKRLWLTVSRP